MRTLKFNKYSYIYAKCVPISCPSGIYEIGTHFTYIYEYLLNLSRESMRIHRCAYMSIFLHKIRILYT
jgi:hypothetical protein